MSFPSDIPGVLGNTDLARFDALGIQPDTDHHCDGAAHCGGDRVAQRTRARVAGPPVTARVLHWGRDRLEGGVA
jgi:hypothetical protein